MNINLKRFHDNAAIPQKAYQNDFCYDLVAVTEEEIAPNVWKYGLGWGMQIQRCFEELLSGIPLIDRDGNCFGIRDEQIIDISRSPLNLSIDIRPRSSIYKTGMVLSNSVGTVDEGYTNEISAIFYHVMPDMPRYKVGDRVAQMKVGFTFPIQFDEVEKLDETERNLKGYGSSGK